MTRFLKGGYIKFVTNSEGDPGSSGTISSDYNLHNAVELRAHCLSEAPAPHHLRTVGLGAHPQPRGIGRGPMNARQARRGLHGGPIVAQELVHKIVLALQPDILDLRHHLPWVGRLVNLALLKVIGADI